MIPYILTFILTILFSYLYQYLRVRNKPIGRILKFLLAVFIVIFPAVLAGLRSLDLGYDANYYVVPTYNAIRGSSNIFVAVRRIGELIYFDNTGIGLISIEFIVSVLDGSVSGVLFGISFICGISVFVASKYFEQYVDLWVTELVYLTMLYNASYNAMKQCMAICICLVAFCYLLKGKKGKFISLTIIAALFHNTAVLFFVFLPIDSYLNNKDRLNNKNTNENLSKTKLLVVVLFAILFCVFLRPIVQVLDSIFSLNFSRYWDYYKSDLSILRFAIYIMTFIPFLLWKKKIFHKNIISACLWIDFLTYLLSFNIFYFYRISMYFMLPAKAIGYGEIIKNGKHMKLTKKSALIITICIIFWLYTFVYANMHQTIPYKFSS